MRMSPFRRTVRPGQCTVTWTLPTSDLCERALHLISEITDATYARDVSRREALVCELTSLPGYPKHQPGDRIEIEVRRPIIVLPN